MKSITVIENEISKEKETVFKIKVKYDAYLSDLAAVRTKKDEQIAKNF
jgi:hypothetical protein